MSNFVIENGVLIKYTGEEETVIIPEEITAIGNEAFVTGSFYPVGCETVKAIILPKGLQKIGYRSFCGCENLTAINLPDGLVEIGPRAFEDCTNLSDISIPNGVKKIGSRAFFDCENITQLVIPDAVKQIDAGTFSGCVRLESINIPANVKKIGEGALDELYSLREISVDSGNPSFTCVDGVLYNKEKTVLIKCPAMKDKIEKIPSSVKEIAGNAFYGCHITEINIPKSVKLIGEAAFGACASLQKVTNNSSASVLKAMAMSWSEHIWRRSEAGWIIYTNGVVNDGYLPNEVLSDLSAEQKKMAILVFLKNMDKYSEKKQTEYIEYLKKQGSKYLSEYISEGKSESIVLLLKVYAPTIKAIEKALEEAKENTEVTAVLLEYQNSHFDVKKEQEKKEKALEMTIARAEPTVEELKKIWTVKNCEDDKNKCYLTKYKGEEKNVVVPSKIGKKEVVGLDGCFKDQDIQSVEIPSSIKWIGDYAFSGCTNLESIIIPSSVKEIGYYAFEKCSKLDNIAIPRGVKKISSHAFEKCSSLVSVVIPNGVTKIESNTFGGCLNLTSVVIPNSVNKIGFNAFEKCTSLISITIPSNVNEIGLSAFEGCSSLTNIIIPDSVEQIGAVAFSGCTSLKEITIPRNVKEIGFRAFVDCPSLESIIVHNENEVYSAVGNCLIEKESKTLISGCKSSIIPADGSVTRIGGSAFEGCSSLTSIDIPKNIGFIGFRAFSDCTSLAKVIIPGSFQTEGWGMFSGCSNLTVYAPIDSDAERYAKNNKIKFEPIEE